MSRFQRMLDRHADLRERCEGSQELEVKEAFAILMNYCPDICKHPLLAGNTVRNILDSGRYFTADNVKDLVDLQLQIDELDSARGVDSESCLYPSLDPDDEIESEAGFDADPVTENDDEDSSESDDDESDEELSSEDDDDGSP